MTKTDDVTWPLNHNDFNSEYPPHFFRGSQGQQMNDQATVATAVSKPQSKFIYFIYLKLP